MGKGDFHNTEKWANVNIVEWEEHGHVGGTENGPSFKRTNDAPKAQIVDEVDLNTTYVGEAIEGSSTSQPLWQIKRITTNGTVTQVTYADGNSQYDNIWDDRASLSYV